ncbi:MAG: hypothetical protein IJM34_12220 [Lachnospiraceae bacterium]|jgi:hypothetical protein|nr:hypothetical protein [Lachnospiraceae bacterium]
MDITNISAMNEYTRSLASAQNTDKLRSDAKSAQTDEEMLNACKEFETYLWEQVIKSMKKSSEVFSGEKQDQTVDYFMDSAITDTARKMTEQTMGSNSLAMQMYEQMKRNAGGLTLEEIEAKQAASGAVENKE